MVMSSFFRFRFPRFADMGSRRPTRAVDVTCAKRTRWVIMAATALEMMTLYLLMSQGTRFDVESSFQESNIVPDVISTAPPIAAEVRIIVILPVLFV